MPVLTGRTPFEGLTSAPEHLSERWAVVPQQISHQRVPHGRGRRGWPSSRCQRQYVLHQQLRYKWRRGGHSGSSQKQIKQVRYRKYISTSNPWFGAGRHSCRAERWRLFTFRLTILGKARTEHFISHTAGELSASMICAQFC